MNKDEISSPVPILMITWDRLDYTKRALDALLKADNVFPYIFDNGSTDGTQDYLRSLPDKITMWFSEKNEGIATPTNIFLRETKGFPVVGKCDNDCVIPKDFIDRMLPHLEHCDIVQARHNILKATHPLGFDEWVKSMPQKGALRFNKFVGGCGVIWKRDLVDSIPKTDWVLGPWRQFQREHPELKKAFATDVTIELLDTDENGANYPKEYEQYYKSTGRK